MKTFKIASCQMDVVDNKSANINHAIELIKIASSNHADIVTLPEMFNTPYDNNKFIENAEDEDESPTLDAMCQVAQDENIYLQCGSIAEKEEDDIYNTAYLISPEGDMIAKHRKMHLFDIDCDTMKFTESDTLTAGDKITTVKTHFARISLAICYDVRFNQMWTLMNENKTDLALLPGAFNKITGPLHWETLLRARAIDNQFFVVATSPSQVENPYYVAWGHSMIVDPWGNIMAQAEKEEQILYSELNPELITSVREQIPILKNKRDDIYKTLYTEK